MASRREELLEEIVKIVFKEFVSLEAKPGEEPFIAGDDTVLHGVLITNDQATVIKSIIKE